MRKKVCEIKGFENVLEGYEVDDSGIVYYNNDLVKIYLSGGRNKDHRYLVIDLKTINRSKSLRVYVHRLVAFAFIEGYFEGAEVNHLDEDKTNNCVSNLEWCDRKHNVSYGTGIARQAASRSKKVGQYDLEGNLIKVWSSTQSCKKEGYSQWHVCECANGIIETYRGYRWRYINE